MGCCSSGKTAQTGFRVTLGTVTAYSFDPDTKFAAIHLCHCSHDLPSEPVMLSNGLAGHSSPVLSLSDLDKSWLGVDYAKAFDRSVALTASMPSKTPGIMDEESKQLGQRAHMLLFGVLTQGMPNFWPGIVATGSKVGDEAPWANRLEVMDRFYRHGGVLPLRITADALRVADALVPGLMEVFPGHKVPAFARLRRGFNSLIDAWKSGDALDRLHLFVRALDGLMKLEKSQGERQFVERTTMIAAGAKLDEVAREMFRLRSLKEHLSEWPSELGYIKEPDRDGFVSLRAFQAEVLAGEAYHRVLADPSLRAGFSSEDDIAAFWNGHAEDWGTKIDLDALVKARYVGEV